MNLFADIPSEYFIYFLYGSAFLFLSFAIFIKDMKGSDLKLAESLWLLALFGFTHGSRELLELYPLVEGEHLTLSQIFHVKILSLAVLLSSFLFLLQFGLALIPNKRRIRSWTVTGLLVLAWISWTAEHGFPANLRLLGQSEIGARYIFCLPSSLLTGYGLIRYSREVKILSLSASRHLRLAGVTFGFYGIFAGLFVTRISFIPLPFPVELLRGLSAVSIAYFIVKALNIFDVETRKRIEEQTMRLVQTEKLTSLGQLAAGIAHEINNPLTNASLGIQMLKQKLRSLPDGGDDIERLDAVERNIDRASSIARELLQLARQEDSKFVPVDINLVIGGTLTLMKQKLDRITVRQDFAPVPEIMGDPGRLDQVFINILANSLEAMPGGGTIAIATFQKNSQVVVRIEDSGIGIPEKKISRIFDPFFTTKELGRGTGLGLTISYGIIRRHKGSIQLTSRSGAGTTVTITLPVKEYYEKDIDRG